MLKRKLSLMVIAGLTLLLWGGAAALAGSTQFGVAPKNLVTLVSAIDSHGLTDFKRVNRDSSTATGFFRVKSGEFLVVTDVEFLITGGSSGEFVTLDLTIVKVSNTSKFSGAFMRSLSLDDNGKGSGNIPMTAGFVVDSSARPGAQLSNPALTVEIILHGYITS